jgi:hypothetical protein
MKSEREQEVRVQVDVSLTLSTRHDAATVQAIVERGLRGMFPNNHKVFNSARFAEEAAIYSSPSPRIRWICLHRPAGSKVGAARKPVSPSVSPERTQKILEHVEIHWSLPADITAVERIALGDLFLEEEGGCFLTTLGEMELEDQA